MEVEEEEELVDLFLSVTDVEVARSDLQMEVASHPRLPEIFTCTLPLNKRSKPFPQGIFPTPKFISTTSSSVPRTASVDPMPLLFLPPSKRLSSTFSTNAQMLSTKKSSKFPPPPPNLKYSSSTTIKETILNSQAVFLCNKLLARASSKARPSMEVVELPSDPSVVDLSVVVASLVVVVSVEEALVVEASLVEAPVEEALVVE